jgi:HSP20 family protein
MLTNRTLNATIDRMFTLNRALEQTPTNGSNAATPVWVPALDVVERASGYTIYAELPGVDPDSVDVSFESNVLTIRGTKQPSVASSKDGELRAHLLERESGSFARSVWLPEYVDGDHIEARFVNGVLQVAVPKSPAALPRKIKVGVGAEVQQSPK